MIAIILIIISVIILKIGDNQMNNFLVIAGLNIMGWSAVYIVATSVMELSKQL